MDIQHITGADLQQAIISKRPAQCHKLTVKEIHYGKTRGMVYRAYGIIVSFLPCLVQRGITNGSPLPGHHWYLVG